LVGVDRADDIGINIFVACLLCGLQC